MNTIRTYPRTLGEAFKGVDYACAVERPSPGFNASRALVVATVLAACVLLIGVTS